MEGDTEKHSDMHDLMASKEIIMLADAAALRKSNNIDNSTDKIYGDGHNRRQKGKLELIRLPLMQGAGMYNGINYTAAKQAEDDGANRAGLRLAEARQKNATHGKGLCDGNYLVVAVGQGRGTVEKMVNTGDAVAAAKDGDAEEVELPQPSKGLRRVDPKGVKGGRSEHAKDGCAQKWEHARAMVG